MSDEILWQMFADTGDPMSWLMYRASEKNKSNKPGGGDSFAAELIVYICLKRQGALFCARFDTRKPTGY